MSAYRYWKYANIDIPAGVEVFRVWDNWEPRTTFVTPISVRAKMPCYKDGRPFGRHVCWSFSYCNRPYLLEQINEPKTAISGVEVKKAA